MSDDFNELLPCRLTPLHAAKKKQHLLTERNLISQFCRANNIYRNNATDLTLSSQIAARHNDFTFFCSKTDSPVTV